MHKLITAEDVSGTLTWTGAVAALEAGHLLPRAEVKDLFLGPAGKTLMARAALIEGLGYGVKCFTVTEGNAARGLPSVQGVMVVFDGEDGRPVAEVECGLVTGWKTVADSLLGARLLARPDSRSLLVVGGGAVAARLVEGYRELFPDLERITVWARDPDKARAFAHAHGIAAEADLETAVRGADIVTSATMARRPILRGDWLSPGTHLELIGAFTGEMREADDAAITKGRLFVDSRATTIGHIGEITIPMAAGVIAEADVLGDLYDLVPGAPGRVTAEDITVFKNGGGAHLDLMTARYIAAAAS